MRSWNVCMASPICLRLLVHLDRLAASRTFWTAGSSSPIRTATIAITTNSSISVNARRVRMEVPSRKFGERTASVRGARPRAGGVKRQGGAGGRGRPAVGGLGQACGRRGGGSEGRSGRGEADSSAGRSQPAGGGPAGPDTTGGGGTAGPAADQ